MNITPIVAGSSNVKPVRPEEGTEKFDSSPSTLILTGSPEKEYHDKITRVFGSDQILLIALSTGDVLQPRTLQDIRALTGQLEQIPGIRRVLSLTNVSDLKGERDEVAISPLVPEDLQSLNREALQARIQTNPLFVGNLVSKDLQTACLILFMEEFAPRSALAQGREVTRQVRSKVRSMGAKYSAIIGGVPEMELEGTENMIRDLFLFTPLTLILVFSILILNFHSLRCTLLPLAVIGLTLSWTIGAMTWAGVPLKVSTLVLPSLLISNGCSYVIHFLSQYRRILARNYLLAPEQVNTERGGHHNAILATLKLTHTPIFISALTTMAGFGSLAARVDAPPTMRIKAVTASRTKAGGLGRIE